MSNNDDFWKELEKYRSEVAELEMYSDMMEDEFGEYTKGLCLIALMDKSEEFDEALKKEVRACLKYYKDHFDIVKKTHTFTKTYTTLEEKYEEE